jgi:predicted TIM-barrel fold metal-dependent hydrolase
VKDLLVIDADGHVTEQAESLQPYLSPEFRDRPLVHREPWDRSLNMSRGKNHDDPRIQLADLDADGIDVQVIYPTLCLNLNHLREPALAVDLARAYNDWLADFCAADPRRLKGVAMVALQDVDAAIREARRATAELGFVGVMLPTNCKDQDLGQRQYWPFYEAMQDFGVPLGMHCATNLAERFTARFDRFISIHTIAFPFEAMAALTGLVFAGVPAVFPSLRIAVLESSIGWLPFLMDRMDEEFEQRGFREAPLLQRKPSEYLAGEQFYYGFELEESTLPYVIARLGADRLLYASDYPHWDTEWPRTTAIFLGRDDIADADKRRILGENPQHFYGFRVDAPAPAPTA